MSDPILTSDKVLDGLARDMARLHTNGGSLPKGPYRGAQAGVRNAAVPEAEIEVVEPWDEATGPMEVGR